MATAVHAFRAACRERPLLPYEVLADADHWSPKARGEAAAVVGGVWRRSGFPGIELTTPLSWDDLCSSDRSWAFDLHSWDFLGQVLAGYSATRQGKMLDFALRLALDWATQYPTYEKPSERSFAWYDMAVGMRSYRLAYILDAAARSAAVDDDDINTLLRSGLLHAEVLANDDLYPKHSNHGVYFAAGQAALGRRFPDLGPMREAAAEAEARLSLLIDSQFTQEGVHREHSPDYHRMLLESLSGLVAAHLLEGEGLIEKVREIQHALAWFVLPNGSLAMFGDTCHRVFGTPEVLAKFEDPATDAAADQQPFPPHPALQFVLSNGRVGSPPADTLRAFPISGYAVLRDGWPAPDDDPSRFSYLAQTCAFHSRTHKHADDLAFVWHDRGQELLIDAGRYGYLGRTEPGSELWRDGHWYSDPNRVFVESTAAHNTVEIDGKNHPRFDTEPYGSALEACGEQGELLFTVAACSYHGVLHRRVLALAPSRWLLVFDNLQDSNDEPHVFVQRFQVSPRLDLVAAQPALSLVAEALEEPLHCISLSKAELVPPVRGQTEPTMSGWVSLQDRAMIPTFSLGYRGEGSRTSFVTLWAFGSDRPLPLEGSFSDTSEDSTWSAEAAWEQTGRRERVVLSSHAEGGVRLRHEVAVI